MKRIVLLFLGLLLLSGIVAAYRADIEAPESLAVGKPLVVTGTTTFGIGTPIDVVLYYQQTTTTEIKRKIVYIQNDKTFKAVFDTTGLVPGLYKVEIPSTSNSDSITMRLVTLFDRTEDIVLSSPVNQTYTGTISVTGEIRNLKNSGVQMEVIDPDGLVIFGPRYINTDNAARFYAEIPVPRPGTYEVSFTDSTGYIGSRTVTSVGPAQPGGPAAATTVPTERVALSAHTRASRDAPAYFIVEAGTGPVTLYTSKSLDWVVEYIDDRGVLHMENVLGEQGPERVEFQGRGKTVYVKIYPYKYATTGDIFLYGENVRSITVSTTAPAPFAATAPETSSYGIPLVPGLAALAIAAAIVLAARKRD